MVNIGVRTKARFIAGELAPTVEDALAGEPVVNRIGNVAFIGFGVDSHNSRSEVKLDTEAVPPALLLNEAITQYTTGKVDPKTEEFVHDGIYKAAARVTGTYTGPGSELVTY